MVQHSGIEHDKFIEIISLWEGRINTTHLQKKFSISRQTATKIIKAYTDKYPGNLDYDPSLKGYIPTSEFSIYNCAGTIEEYFNILLNSGELHCLTFLENHFNLIEVPLRNISPQLVRPIIHAIRNNERLDVGYASVSSPEFEERIISPHALVFNGIRWHVRAYCEKNQDYRDFVLSRFSGIFNSEGKSPYTQEHDKKWNTWVDLIIEPDPRLSNAQKRIIEMDYQMENGQRTLKTRAALLMYLLQKLHLEQYKPTAEAQQIIVNSECWKRIEQYLPK